MNQQTELRRSTLPVAESDQLAETFPTADRAIKHLHDHLLTAPECEGWAILLPKWAELLGENGPAEQGGGVPARASFIQRVNQTAGAHGQELFDDWIRELDRQRLAAVKLGWVARNCDEQTGQSLSVNCLGIHAVRLIYEPRQQRWVLSTAYIAGHGDAAEVNFSNQENRLRRDRSHSRHDRRGPESHRERMDRLDREAGWSDDQRYFNLYFRPAIGFLRRVATGAPGMQTRKHLRLKEEQKQADKALLWQAVRETRPRTWVQWRDLRNEVYPSEEQLP